MTAGLRVSDHRRLYLKLTTCIVFGSFIRIVWLDSDDRALIKGASAVTVTVS